MKRLWQWLRSDAVAFNDDPQVERYFLGCTGCGTVRPYYHLIAAKDEAVMTCPKCGDRHVKPVIVTSWLKGMWLVLIRGYLWRHVVLRKPTQQQWDPRMPYLRAEFPGFHQ